MGYCQFLVAIFLGVIILRLLPVLWIGGGVSRDLVNAQDWGVFARIMGVGCRCSGASRESGRALGV